jgi:hypothetical protein
MAPLAGPSGILMAESEEKDALRLLHFNWLVIGGLAAALAVAMLATGFSL